MEYNYSSKSILAGLIIALIMQSHVGGNCTRPETGLKYGHKMHVSSTEKGPVSSRCSHGTAAKASEIGQDIKSAWGGIASGGVQPDQGNHCGELSPCTWCSPCTSVKPVCRMVLRSCLIFETKTFPSSFGQGLEGILTAPSAAHRLVGTVLTFWSPRF